ncbi:MAG: hypothetical protein IKM66_07095 [Clostridia bacterium]|nr:hypothetical protein [Clostridia bacterium]
MNRKKIQRMIDSGFTELSSEKIKKLIEAEVRKGENADTDYIDLCFELLEIKENQTTPVKYRPRSVKTLLIAAIVFVLIVSVVTASVYAIYFNIPDNVSQLKDNDAYIDINWEHSDTTADGYQLLESDLAKELEAHGITPVTFPEKLLTDDCVITSIEYPETDKTLNITAFIEFEYQGIYSNITISQNNHEMSWIGENTQMNVISGQMINVNGMDILFFEREKSCSVQYKDNCTEYQIYLECDADTVLEFVNSIK